MSKKKKAKSTPQNLSELHEGTVIRSVGSSSRVLTPAGEQVECIVRGKFRIKGIKATNPVAVGDEVLFAYSETEEKGVIQQILPRKNYILRRAIGHNHKVHVIAANIDQAILLYTIDSPRTSTGFADRFLVVAEAYHIPVQIVINKLDLIQDTPQKEKVELIKQTYESAGYPVMTLSALDKQYIPKIEELLIGKRSFIGGHSGAGKSTLINLIDPDLDIKTGEISDYHQKGTHTTTYAEMHHLSAGGYIIDTPGIKEWGITDFTAEDIGHYFPEILSRMSECKFSDCSHIHEPGCAVIKAFEEGTIPESRYKNYQKMREEILSLDNY